MQKRCLTIQDYSCLGRCSLTVALPVLSAAGIEVCGIPTAVLSNHTAGFKSWTYADLTSYIKPTVEHWRNYKHHFDAIYTGYLATEQVPLVLDVINELQTENTKIIVDPAFADNGKLYPAFKQNHVLAMRTLMSKSDVILPNLTEAYYLADMPYNSNYEEKDIQKLLLKLASLGPQSVVISGISFKEGTIGCYSYDGEEKKFDFYQTSAYEGVYHGTGDLFASAFISSLLNGTSFKKAIRIAHNVVHLSIAKTLEEGTPEIYYGVEFEKALPYLISCLNKDY